MVSAGWETMAQKIPAKQPEAKVTPNWVDFEQLSLPKVKTLSQKNWTNHSKATNFTIVYGTCLDQSGTIPLQNPDVPYSALSFAKAPVSELGYSNPGLDNWILSLRASQGQRRRSAITSAEPEATDHPTFLYLSAFSSPTIFLYTSLKISQNPNFPRP